MRKLPLLWQLFITFFAVSLLVMLTLGMYAAELARQSYVDRVTADLEAMARLVAVELPSAAEMEANSSKQDLCDLLAKTLGVRITVIDPSGKVLADSAENPQRMDNHRDRPEIAKALAGDVGRETRRSNTLHEDFRYVAVPLRTKEDKVEKVVRVAVSLGSLSASMRALNGGIFAACVAAAVLVAGASFWTSRRALHPLAEIQRGAVKLAQGELDYRIHVAGSDEIRALADSLNAMARQLDARIRTILRQEHEHEAMLSSMEEGVLALDNQGVIISLNDAAAQMVGADPHAIRGRSVYETIRKAEFLRFVESTLKSGVAIDGEVQLFGESDSWLHAHSTSLLDGENRRIGVLIVMHDVTRLRHLENVRRDFVANVSHELKTPITSIKGFVETLLDESLENKENSMRFLHIVLKQVNRLDAIIHDLLSLSRIERGAEQQVVPLEPAKLNEALHSAVEMCEQKAAEKNVPLIVECPDDLIAEVNAPLLEQAITNLIDNAIKYSDPGKSIRIEARRNENELVISVQDRGCGIAAEHLPRLFERFYRVDKARSRDLGGTGLGLSIVKHIAVAHRGTVEVESVVGSGSTFYIRLPIG